MAINIDEKAQLANVQNDLLRVFSDVPPARVRKEFRASVSRFEGAPVRTYLPVLVQKRVREDLRKLA